MTNKETQTEAKTPRWYPAELINVRKGSRYCYIRKSANPGQVIVFNGHFMISVIDAEKAKSAYRLLSKNPMKNTDSIEKDFQWALHY